jgi:hypothetical protein
MWFKTSRDEYTFTAKAECNLQNLSLEWIEWDRPVSIGAMDSDRFTANLSAFDLPAKSNFGQNYRIRNLNLNYVTEIEQVPICDFFSHEMRAFLFVIAAISALYTNLRLCTARMYFSLCGA